MKVQSMSDTDTRVCVDCRLCRFFKCCAVCEYNKECTNQGEDKHYSGCCDNKNHRGMVGCWCPENYGCSEGQLVFK